ncbi:MAG: hypothetical protein WCY25_03010 [Moheibacter sp.]
MKNQLLKYTLTIIYLMSNTVALLADSGDPNDPDASDDPSAPIDGGILWLILIGLIVGIYYLNLHKKVALDKREK